MDLNSVVVYAHQIEALLSLAAQNDREFFELALRNIKANQKNKVLFCFREPISDIQSQLVHSLGMESLNFGNYLNIIY